MKHIMSILNRVKCTLAYFVQGVLKNSYYSHDMSSISNRAKNPSNMFVM